MRDRTRPPLQWEYRDLATGPPEKSFKWLFFFPSQKVSDVFLYWVLFASGKCGYERAAGFHALHSHETFVTHIRLFPTICTLTGLKKGLPARPHWLGSSDKIFGQKRIWKYLALPLFGSGKVLTSFVLHAFALPNRFAVKVPTSVEFWEGTNFWIRDLYLAMLFLTHIGKKIYLVKHNHMCKLQEKKR